MRLRITLLFLLSFSSFTTYAAPLEFIANAGQWREPFLYRAISREGDIYLERGGFTYQIGAGVNHALMEEYRHHRGKGQPVLRYHAYRMLFEGGNAAPEVVGSKPQSHYYNYFLGADPARWKGGLHPYLAVDYKGVYPGIDAHVYSHNGRMKYEFIVAAGADIDLIRLRYEGTNGLKTSGGKLQIATSVGTVEELQPYAYQYIGGEKKEVRCSYRIERNVVSYFFPKGYDTAETLIIDPTVVFGTYTGSTADNWGFTATYDNAGNFYSGGIANSTGYPVTTGALQTTYGGGSLLTNNMQIESDIVITKFNPGGTALVYSTYIGGSDNEQPHSLVVDSAGRLTVMGRTYSSNYPTTSGAYDPTYNGEADICLTKLNAAGSALTGSTYIGGSDDDAVNETADPTVFGILKHNYGDDSRGEVIVDMAGNVYVAACTISGNFPTTSAAQGTSGGAQDAVVFKMNAGLTALQFSTYLGGSDIDAAYSLALDTGQRYLFVTGGTRSGNFPTTTGSLIPSYRGGDADGFIARYGNGGSYPLQRCTYIGRGDYDQCYGVQTDLSNNVYVNGQTLSGDFPVTSGVYSNPHSSQFVMAVDTNLGTTIFSTVYGTNDSTATNISPVAFLVDSCRNIYISGWGGSLANFSSYITGLPVTTNAAQGTTNDGADFYFIVFTPFAQNLLYASYMGGDDAAEHVDGGTSRFDKHGVVYQAMCGGCGGFSDFPTTTGAWSTTNNSTNCNLIAFKQAFEFGAVDAGANPIPGTRGCIPFTVTFQNTSASAKTYLWDFGDGTPVSTLASPAHTFTKGGIFTVRLIAFNPDACKTRDTIFLVINVKDYSIKADFTFEKLDSCSSPRVAFTNTSQYKAGPSVMFDWDFGDGTTFTGAVPPVHNYATMGTYSVKLVITDTSACNSPDSVIKMVDVNGFLVKAGFAIQDTVCGLNISLNNSSQRADTYAWDFGDGQTATGATPTHTYAAAGTYTIRLIAINPLACNGADTFVRQVTIKNKPTADFSATPQPPVPNEAIQFTNQSSGATRYLWDFGYATQRSTAIHPSHLYPATATYNVCLIAYNDEGCTDTVCKPVDAAIDRIADVPNAFSPNGDGRNDILFVHGAAILQFSFRLFDRWGHMVFETSSLDKGWDGSYNGQPAPTEGYAYLMDVTFTDKVTLTKKGNITLLR